MKPFDLTACIAGKPVVTRDGRPYEFASHKKGVGLLGWIGEQGFRHDEDGSYIGSSHETKDDLFMACEEREVWVNVYDSQIYDQIYKTESIAKLNAGISCIGQVKLTYRVPDKGEEK